MHAVTCRARQQPGYLFIAPHRTWQILMQYVRIRPTVALRAQLWQLCKMCVRGRAPLWSPTRGDAFMYAAALKHAVCER